MRRAQHTIDLAWCDVSGVYLGGWGHAHGQPIDRVTLRSGGCSVAVELKLRPDVLAAFPFLPPEQRTGFAAYLACPPFRPVALRVESGGEAVELDVTATEAQGPRAAPEFLGPAPMDRFIAEMKARRGTVLELGARVVGAHSSLNAPQFEPECRFIGADIHPAPGVDVVADAHFLSAAVAPGSIDGLFSIAVVEHLAAPWLVAAEINRVLRLGGLTLQVVPHAWPAHEQPNDFWRMSDDGLAMLFGPATGFEILERGMTTPFQIVPPVFLRTGDYINLPLLHAYGAAFILSRKVAELPKGAVRWPMPRAEMEARSRAYPAHGAEPGAPGPKARRRREPPQPA